MVTTTMKISWKVKNGNIGFNLVDSAKKEAGKGIKKAIHTISTMALQGILVPLTAIISKIIGREITVKTCLRLLHMNLALCALLLFGGISPLLQIGLFLWVAIATWRCSLCAELKDE